MSILIRGMEMPQEGSWKTICIYSDGTCEVLNWQGDWTLLKGVQAVEVPPHGRLIDADALFREISKRTNAAYEWRQKATDEDIQARADATYMAFVEVALTISKLPTIVDAEGE